MGSLFSTRSSPSAFAHLKPEDSAAKSLSNHALSAEEQALNTKLLQIIDANFKSASNEWNALRQNDMTEIKAPNGCVPSEISDTILLGDHRAASNADVYSAEHLGVTHVVNCAASEFVRRYPSHVKVLRVRASDHHKYAIIERHIADIICFVDEALSLSGDAEQHRVTVLFHCLAGVNRSVALCIAYLMHRETKLKGQSTEQIVDLVSRRRSIGVLSNHFKMHPTHPTDAT